MKKASQAYFGLPAFLAWIVHCFRGYAETTALFPCIDRPAAVCIRGSNNFNFYPARFWEARPPVPWTVLEDPI